VLEDQGQARPGGTCKLAVHVGASKVTAPPEGTTHTHARTTTHYAEPSPALLLRASHRIASHLTPRPPLLLLLLLANSSGNPHDTTTDRHRSDSNVHCQPAPGTHEIIELSQTRLLDTPASARA